MFIKFFHSCLMLMCILGFIFFVIFFGYFLGIFGFVGCVMRSCWTVVLSHSLMLTAQSVEGQSERDLKDFFSK